VFRPPASPRSTAVVEIPDTIRSVVDTLLPPLCLHCGAALVSARPGICSECLATWRRPAAGCRRCGLPGFAGDGCGRCREWPEGLVAVAGVRHEGSARTAVHALKYRGWRHLAATCALPMAEALAGTGLRVEAVAHVPLHPVRRRERGYDQARLLAVALAHRTGLPAIDPLERVRSTAPQVGRARRARTANVAGAFRVRPGRAPRGAVALVDDVATSGATLAAAAGPLLEAGVERLVGTTFSLAPRPGAV